MLHLIKGIAERAYRVGFRVGYSFMGVSQVVQITQRIVVAAVVAIHMTEDPSIVRSGMSTRVSNCGFYTCLGGS